MKKRLVLLSMISVSSPAFANAWSINLAHNGKAVAYSNSVDTGTGGKAYISYTDSLGATLHIYPEGHWVCSRTNTTETVTEINDVPVKVAMHCSEGRENFIVYPVSIEGNEYVKNELINKVHVDWGDLQFSAIGFNEARRSLLTGSHGLRQAL